MNIELLSIRLKKLLVSITHISCWRALRFGVAPSIEHYSILKALKVDGIIDVGANRGQFSLLCHLTQDSIPITAFEPIPAEAAVFQRVHRHRLHVKLMECALGESSGTAILHLSRSADSSSLLPIGKKQTELFDNTGEVGTLSVPVARLDDFEKLWVQRRQQLLKLDVQGFELNVLRGAERTLKSCAYVYAECSEIPLYENQALRAEVESFLAHHGFVLKSRHNEQVRDESLIQADYLFERAKSH